MSQILEMLQNSLFEHPCWTSCKSCKKIERWYHRILICCNLTNLVQIGEEKPSLAAYNHLFADLSISRAVYTLASSSPLLFRLKSVELGFAHMHRWQCSYLQHCCNLTNLKRNSQPQQWRLDFCIFPIWAVYTFASFFFFCSHEKGWLWLCTSP